MCCFSRPVKFVGRTRIFARGDADRQLLAYAMAVEVEHDLAMVLPLPVPRSSSDDAVSFISLEGYASFFDDLELAFPPDYSTAPLGRSHPASARPQGLVVHDVGAFEASFVPTVADFGRLDARFRLPDHVWRSVPQYADYGFAVFRLKPKAGTRQQMHPMALSFRRRDPNELYFPSLHVHDGSVPKRARFDHMLFCQVDGVLDATLDWAHSKGPLGALVDPSKSGGLLDGKRSARRAVLHGERANTDVFLRAPDGITLNDLFGRGLSHSYSVRAGSAYADDTWDGMRRTWRLTAQTKLPSLCRVLREDLAGLLDARRNEWSLAPLEEDLPHHFLNGNQLWSGTDYASGSPAMVLKQRGRVAFRIFTEQIEPQDITLAFARLPEPRLLDSIRGELTRLVERAVA
jgi:hypothetical protein